jgi:glycosyltransferase involved in cell wall biosynthesis
MSQNSNSKIKILVFIDWFLPAYKAGGPIQSVNNIIQHFSNTFDFYVITSNRDLNEIIPSIETDKWHKKEKYSIYYLSDKSYNKQKIEKLIKNVNPDFCYFNSLFSIKYSFTPLKIAKKLKIPTILATRGMLGKGALAIKPIKKKLFLAYFKLLNLHRYLTFHATALEERNEIIATFGEKTKVKLASNLAAPLPDFCLKKKAVNKLNLFFLSRINPKKNLKQVLTVLSKIRQEFEVKLSIIGPIDDENYWGECQKLISNLRKNILVEVLGAIPHQEISKLLTQEHLLFLPTNHENYGHVIVEAWQNSCPVIISQNTPWRALTEKTAGYDLDSEEDYIKTIEFFCKMTGEEFLVWNKGAFKMAELLNSNDNELQNTLLLFS